MADWSSLPSDFIRRIAECLLSTNDLDCYMDFRAVCPTWRSTTDDPTNSSDLRFRPIHWIIIDEVFQTDARLLVNTATGRVVRKDLPLLSRFYVVATTHGGFFVLADKEPPNAVRILNPFTGQMTLFTASVPSDIDISAASLGGNPISKLILLSDRCYERYVAAVDSEAFIQDSNMYVYIFTRMLVDSGLCGNSAGNFLVPPPVALAKKIFALIKSFDIDPDTVLREYAGQGHGNSYFLVKSGSQLLVIVMQQHQLKVFDVTNYGDEPEPVKSIGDHAIFLGHRRCVCVSADKFPSVAANCIYYVKNMNSPVDIFFDNASLYIYKYDLEVEKAEMVSEAVNSLNPVTSSCDNFPSTIVQLLSSYTINVRESQLPKEKFYFPDWFLSLS